MALDIQKEIDRLRQIPDHGNYLATALERIAASVNILGTNAGVDPTGAKLPAPAPVGAVNIKTDSNGTVYGSISDASPLKRGIHYFMEYDTDPSFSRPHVVHMGASRTMVPHKLPAKDDNGKAVNYYFRAYSQYPGSDPGEKMAFGGSTPTPVAPGGAVQLSLFPSTGSGSTLNTGEEGGRGFGTVLFRPQTGPKRSSGQAVAA